MMGDFKRRWLAVPLAALAAAVLLVIQVPLHAQSAAEDDGFLISEQDWPCHGRFRIVFSAGSFWQGPSLDGIEGDLQRDAEVLRLAERLVAPETGEDTGRGAIEAFAAGLESGPGRERRLAGLFAAVLAESNLYRRFVMEGIAAMVARRRLAAEQLAATEVKLQILAEDRSSEAADQRKTLEQRRFWQNRAFERADGDSRFLCHRLTALEGKLGILSRAIAGRL